MLFKFRGKPEKVSREQVRAFLHASLAVLSYHNRHPCRTPILVVFRKGLADWGLWRPFVSRIDLRSDLDHEEMLTTCLHEVIHACIRFPEETKEKCTSTLCSKLKSDVAQIAELLVKNAYRRAAFIAHTKMSYAAKNGDHYDPCEDLPVGVTPRYQRK